MTTTEFSPLRISTVLESACDVQLAGENSKTNYGSSTTHTFQKAYNEASFLFTWESHLD